ncbi:hypothetical protein BDR03DRAFT_984985 [Suillus americanus]|nr:hypothetical protein BDR03DRAFT_984985 [Suillus americanus]
MQSSNLPAGAASSAWWSGPPVNGPLDQRFQGDFTISPELLAMHSSLRDYRSSGHQHHVNDNTAFRSIPENSMFSHSETADDRTFYYPQDPWCPPPVDDDLTQAYVWQIPPVLAGDVVTAADGTVPYAASRTTRKLGMHLGEFHGIHGNDKKEVTCFWQDCNQKMQRGGIGRHIISCHMKTRWYCPNCTKTYSRRDAMKKHAKDCQGA